MEVEEDKNKDKDTEKQESGTEGGVPEQQGVGTGGEQVVQSKQTGQVDAVTAGQTESTGKASGATAVDGRSNVPLIGGYAPRFEFPRLNLGANLPTIGSLAPKDWSGNLDFSDKEKTKAAAKRYAEDAALTDTEKEYKDMTFEEAMRNGKISPAEYFQMTAKRAKAEGRELNPYELVLQASYWRDEKTPEQRKKEERNERLGLLFDNLGSLASNAIDTGMAFKGGMPVKASSEAANKRAEQIEAQRKAAQERIDTALLNARLAMAKTKEEREKLMAQLAASAQEKYLDRESRAAIAAANRQSSEAIAKANRELKEKEGERNRRNQKAIAREGNETRLKIAERGNDKWPTVTASMDNNGGFTNRKYNLNNNDDVVHLYEALKKQYPNRFKSEENPSIGEMRTKIMIEVANRDNESDTGISVVTSNDYGRRFLPSGKDNDGSENY